MKILYVEDEIPHVELAKRALEENLKDHFVLFHRESFQSALALLKSEQDIDMVLSDLRLPDGSGLDLLDCIQKMDSPPLVVLITGQGDEQVAVAAIKAGAADYLVKQGNYLHRLPIIISNAFAQKKLKQEQHAKQETEFRYQSLIEQTPAVVFLDNADELETTFYISPRIEELTGFTPEEWKEDPYLWENNIYPEDRTRILEKDRLTHIQSERFQDEYRFIRRDGKVIWIKEDTNLVRDSNGSALYWQGILIDITREKDNETALQRQLLELTILNGVTAASVESDSEDQLIERVVQKLSLLYNEIIGILLLDEKGEFLTPHPSLTGASIPDGESSLPVTRGITGRAVLDGAPIRLGNVNENPSYIEISPEINSELCVPIRVNRRIIGVLDVESKKLNAYTQYDENFLGTIAGNLGTAIENLRLVREEKRRAHEMNALYQSTRPLTQSLEPHVIAMNLLKIMDDLLGHEYSSIHLIDEMQDRLVPIAVSPKARDPKNYQLDPELYLEKDRSLDEGVIGWVARNRKVFRSGKANRDDRYLPVLKNVQSELCVPLVVRDKTIGVINIESTRQNAYSQKDEDLLITIANSAAITLENARLYETERLRRAEAESLREATASLSLHIEIDPLLEQILTSIRTIVAYDSASVFLETDDGEMKIVAARGFNPKLELIGRVVPHSAKWDEVMNSRQCMIIPDAQTDPRFEKWEGAENIHGWMGVPMVTQEKVIGFINLDSHKPNTFTDRDATLAQTFANSAAVAVQNAGLYQDALRASERRAVLHRISQDIVRFSQDSERIFATIHEAAAKLMPCDVFRIALRNETTRENVFAYTMEAGVRYNLPNEPMEKGLAGRVMNSGERIILKSEEETGSYPRFGSDRHVQSAVAVPMQIGDRIIGMISAQCYESEAYGSEEQALLEMLATHAATAIENLRLYNETERRLREMETINRISSSLRRTQSQQAMYELLLDETLSILDANSGSIWIFEPEDDQLVQRIARGEANRIPVKQMNRGQGIVGRVFSTGEVYISSDLKSDPTLKEENRSVLTSGLGGACIPIQSTAGTLGVLIVQVETSHLVPQQINLLTTLAELAGNAIHRAELFDQSQEQVRRLTTLRDIDSAINSSTELRVTLNLLSDHTLRQLRVDAVDILLYHPELQGLSFYSSVGFRTSPPSRPLMRISEGLAGQVVMKGGLVQINDLGKMDVSEPRIRDEEFLSYVGVPVVVKGQIKGVLEVFTRSPLSINEDWIQFLFTLAGQAAIAIDNSQLFDNLQKSNDDLKRAYDTTLEGWAHALELRDRETEGHTRRVTDLTMQLARYLNLPDHKMEDLYRGVLLHDIGKMGVPDQILRKTGPLDEAEWNEMRRHPQYAYDLLSPIQYLRGALDIPYCHHEHWDGSGYPRGLKGEEIPLTARIFSVVDIWDALLSDRPYRKAWPRPKVVEYLRQVSGSILDPVIVQAFLKMISETE